MKFVCAFMLGLTAMEGLSIATGAKFSQDVTERDLAMLDLSIERQGNRVGSCRGVSLQRTALLGPEDHVFISGLNWQGRPFAKSQPIHLGTRPWLSGRWSGRTFWLYRRTSGGVPPDAVNYLLTPHVLYGIEIDLRGRVTDLKTRDGRSLCGTFSS